MITLPARPESLTFAPQQSALIVVDMQNAYASQGGYLDLAGFDVSATRPVIDNINTAVAAARAPGDVVYSGSRMAGMISMLKPAARARRTITNPTR